ncbi:hypothetical protein BZA05DRAFT_422684 [Tricharina praecox]|uniref:uncharacterized protein n=1 Tax=Tricharina praecox TaxID=43433 RepID=UPI00221FC49C|nr:uncharacterized protein BZA05DRAFT_422684 [Tricharina praecox]KAI5841993.1 hypothetical protein BZA05DRAFT_422684 [Tricharina praecox]
MRYVRLRLPLYALLIDSVWWFRTVFDPIDCHVTRDVPADGRVDGAAHTATTEEIKAAIGLAIKELSAAENVLARQRCREEYDRRHPRVGCLVCIRPEPVRLEAESPLTQKCHQPSRSKQPVDIGRRVGVYATYTKRRAVAKERLVLKAEGGATVDTICGRMGWTVGKKSRDEEKTGPLAEDATTLVAAYSSPHTRRRILAAGLRWWLEKP